jgi:Ser/Thr protein kinase RdoA (MazF antagonist)
MINDTYLVEAGAADRFFLKHYRPGMFSDEQIRWACFVQRQLSEKGLPVPAIIANSVGEDLTQVGADYYLLTTWLTGRSHQRGAIPLTAAEAMGATLAVLQRELATLEPVKPYTFTSPAKAAANLEGLLAEAERGSDPLDAVACRMLRAKLATVERLAPQVPRLAALPVQWVHGDFQETNILFDDHDQVMGVIDFDALRCRPRGYEVMRALAICFPPLAPEGFAFFRVFAAAARPLAAEVGLYAALGAYATAIGTFPLGERYREPELYQPRWDRFIREPSGWWLEDCDHLTELLLAQLTA